MGCRPASFPSARASRLSEKRSKGLHRIFPRSSGDKPTARIPEAVRILQHSEARPLFQMLSGLQPAVHSCPYPLSLCRSVSSELLSIYPIFTRMTSIPVLPPDHSVHRNHLVPAVRKHGPFPTLPGCQPLSDRQGAVAAGGPQNPESPALKTGVADHSPVQSLPPQTIP